MSYIGDGAADYFARRLMRRGGLTVAMVAALALLGDWIGGITIIHPLICLILIIAGLGFFAMSFAR